ncbi:hypothetical protein [Methanoregula formicica]|uniref:Uncharacterized protein n=1 Tax=Methanoregula formicica (strain DSM 22288 / NBRC 105244 / SMSP) TaxID=593750 RepID=L0HC81_METFS|nr:hypothetical protein [Methanoregula formicica]AGB01635.1 hypothetical protein Metfor_0572 [Methanoregula formicica SMSP]
MTFSKIGIIAIFLVVIAVAAAGCSGSIQPSQPGTGADSAGGSSPAAGSTSAGTSSGTDLLGGVNYEWAEYKITSNAGGEKVSMFFKYNQKTGKCTMRIEGMEDQTGMLSNLDCSSSGSTGSASDPNDIGSDVKLAKVSTETVTVPAGTFVADKYMASSNGVTAYYWIASGKPLVKMEGGSAEGTVTTELAGWG